jgi:peptidoglycan/xylan/chitin deacetylase (PgdA/CDA1 family)
MPRWFRPPYGVLSTAALVAARRLRLAPVLWTAWGREWTAEASAGSVYATLRAGLAGGGTVLLHDSDCTSPAGSWRAMLGALPLLLDDCARRGLRVGPVSEHGRAGSATRR